MEINKNKWTEWMRSKGLSDKTIKDYNYYFDKFLKVQEINQEQVIKFLNKFKSNNVVRSFVKNIFEYILKAEDHNQEIKQKIKDIELPKYSGKKSKKIPDIISYQEMLGIANAMTNNRDYIMTKLTYYGGLRMSELLNIRPYDFSWSKWLEDKTDVGELKVLGKGKKERIVFIPSETMDQVFKWINNYVIHYQSKEEKLFRIGARHWQRILQKASLKAINKGIKPHLLRHSCATYLLDKGWNIKEVQEYLGHENIATTQIYLHISKQKSKEKYKELF